MLREHIDLELEIEQLVAKRSEVNSEIRPKAKRSAELVHKLDDGTELRDIKCEIREIDDTNEIEIVRLDTREVLERRTMTALERQGQWDWAGATDAKVASARAANGHANGAAKPEPDAAVDDAKPSKASKASKSKQPKPKPKPRHTATTASARA
jgi:hypothetical protein